MEGHMNPRTESRYDSRTIALFAITLLMTAAPTALGQLAISSEIAPGGKLRTALISGNPVLVTKKPDGSNGGVSVELGRFIADKLGVLFEPLFYADPELYTRSFGKGEWDIAIGPRRASEVRLSISVRTSCWLKTFSSRPPGAALSTPAMSIDQESEWP